MKFDLYKKRKPDTHKGDYGHLLVIAGSLGMAGAACLSSEAALRSGCGLVTLGVPESLNAIVQKKLTEVIIKPLPETTQKALSEKALAKILALLKNKDAAAIGPGLSQDKQTVQLVLRLLPHLKIPAVLDADALNSLAGNFALIKKIKAPVIITPHPREMSRLMNLTVGYIQKSRKEVAMQAARKYNITVVLKGHNTVIAHPGHKIYVNKTGNPGMATAGSGDVLCGIISSFLAQGAQPFQAAKLGAYVHGAAGDLAAKQTGEVSLIASDILGKIPQAILKIQKQRPA